MEMVKRNKYDPLHPTAALLIISASDKKPKCKKLSYSESC